MRLYAKAPSQAAADALILLYYFFNIIGGFKMPNIKSAKKRVKVTATKTLRNKMFKSQMKTIIKKFFAAVESGDKAAAQAAYTPAVVIVDKAVKRNIMHKNAAAHKKSQLTLALNKMA